MSAPLPISNRTIRQWVIAVLFCLGFLVGMGVQTACPAEVTKPAALYLGLSAADLGSTRYATSHGATEGNPFMSRNAVPKQLALAGLLTLADLHLQKRGHQKALRIVVAVVRVGAMAVNLSNARRGN